MKQIKRIHYFDILRLAALFGVILIHVAVPIFNAFDPGSQGWWIANIIHGLFKWSVPILFMQSGALLLGKEDTENTWDFYKNRLSKIALPFLTWSVFYALLNAYITQTNPALQLFNILQMPALYHLWFLYILIGLYIITPFLRIIVRSITQKELLGIILLAVFLNGINPLLKSIFGFKIELIIPMFTGYITYFLLGYYLHTYRLKSTSELAIHFLTVACIPVMIIGTYLLSLEKGTVVQNLQEYLSFPIIMLSASIFLLGKQFLNKPLLPSYPFFPLDIARICFGMYLFHPLVLAALRYGLNITAKTEHALLSILGIGLATFTISIIIFVTLDYLEKFSWVRRLNRLIF